MNYAQRWRQQLVGNRHPPVPLIGLQVQEALDYGLRVAAHRGNCAEIKRLMDAGANVNSVDHQGCTGLHLACRGGHCEAVLVLLQLGGGEDDGASINPDCRDQSSRTPLAYACGKGYFDIVKALVLQGGANVNVVMNQGERPLHVACTSSGTRESSLDMTKFLIQRGASVHARNNRYQTPLQVAASSGNEAVIEVLLAANANVLVKDGLLHTCADLALDKGHHFLAKKLQNTIDLVQSVQDLDQKQTKDLCWRYSVFAQARVPNHDKFLFAVACDREMTDAIMMALVHKRADLDKSLLLLLVQDKQNQKKNSMMTRTVYWHVNLLRCFKQARADMRIQMHKTAKKKGVGIQRKSSKRVDKSMHLS